MNSSLIQVNGRIIGNHFSPKGERIQGRIVHIAKDLRPEGPAENAFIYVEESSGGALRAKYISWINLYDIEHAAAQEPGAWCLVEDGSHFNQEVQWQPFGWGGRRLPNVAYLSVITNHFAV